MKPTSRTLLASLLLSLTLAGGCGTDDGGQPGATPAPLDPSTPFPAASTEVPDGFHEELCPDLRINGPSPGLALRLVVPDGFETASKRENGCYFTADMDRSFGVTLDARQSLAAYREEWVDPFEDEGGDDSVSNIEYASDVSVFGDRRGERLTFDPYNDGLPLAARLVQADGVILDWDVPAGTWPRWEEQWDVVSASISVIEGDEQVCADGEIAAHLVTPLPQTESIDSGAGECLLYFRPRRSLLRYAEIEVSPQRTLVERVARLQDQTNVVSVTFEPRAATLAGKPADRLTWVIERADGGYKGPAGTWTAVAVGIPGLVATWSATPEEWTVEKDDYDAWIASFQLG